MSERTQYLKMPGCWDLAELEHDAVPAMPTPATAAVVAASTAAVVSPLSMLKRPRPGGRVIAGHCPSCPVDGCKADLSKCRDYYLRHKVCQAHSKTTLAVVDGREMRFCQKCSRFHLLAEFDEAKRSCRKQLDGHNRRRRKPRVDSMDPWSFMTTQQGLYSNAETMFSSFSAPRPEPSCSGIINSEYSNPYYTQQVLSNSRQNFTGSSSSSNSKEGWYFPFLAERDQMSFSAGAPALEIPVRRPVLKAVTWPPPQSSSNNNMFSDGQLTHVPNSDCALSLLSTRAISPSVDNSWMVCPSGQIPSVAQQHLVPNQQFSSSSWSAYSQAISSVSTTAGFSAFPSMDSEQLNTRTLALSSNDNEMNCHAIFHVGFDGSSDGMSPYQQFSWH